MAKHVAVLFGVAVLTSCAPIMEADRPDPVDLSQFAPGEDRMQVVSEIGTPTGTTVENANSSCDVYKLYTSGPSAVGRGAIAAGEAVGDVLTLGLSEVFFTPVEAMTKDKKRIVLFCYTKNSSKLISVSKAEASAGS